VPGATRRSARHRHRRYEHRLRTRVRRQRGCLASLAPATRELLGLRAGLSGPPLSRSDAATELGISRRSAARIEREGLRALKGGCGGSGGSGTSGGASARVAALAGDAPALQPAVYLPMASAPALQKDLGHRRGNQAVEGATASSPPAARDQGVVTATATSAALGQGGGAPVGLWVAMLLAALAALMLVALRRRAVVQQRGPRMTAAVAAPVAPAAPAVRPVPLAPEPVDGHAAPEQPAPTEAAAPEQPAPTERAAAPVTRVRMRPRDPRRLALRATAAWKRRRG
jgi:hypothetical protein